MRRSLRGSATAAISIAGCNFPSPATHWSFRMPCWAMWWMQPTVTFMLNLSRSTLHRRLAQQNLSFKGIVDSVRRRRAEEYLGLHSVPLHQLAALLGYTNGVSLHRSCLRWFGEPPSLMRMRRCKDTAQE